MSEAARHDPSNMSPPEVIPPPPPSFPPEVIPPPMSPQEDLGYIAINGITIEYRGASYDEDGKESSPELHLTAGIDAHRRRWGFRETMAGRLLRGRAFSETGRRELLVFNNAAPTIELAAKAYRQQGQKNRVLPIRQAVAATDELARTMPAPTLQKALKHILKTAPGSKSALEYDTALRPQAIKGLREEIVRAVSMESVGIPTQDIEFRVRNLGIKNMSRGGLARPIIHRYFGKAIHEVPEEVVSDVDFMARLNDDTLNKLQPPSRRTA